MNILITGATSGLGKQFAYVCAENKNNLIVCGRDQEKLNSLKNELVEKYEIKVWTIKANLFYENASDIIFNEAKKLNISIDALINNAGMGGQGAFIDWNIQDEINMINLNIISVVKLTHLFLKEFVKNNNGKILNVSSTAALCPGPLQAIYFTSKAFITSFSNSLYQEVRNTNVTVTTLMPGALNTNFAKNANLEKTKLFKKSKDPYKAAKKLNVLASLSFGQKMTMKLISITPKKIVLKQIYKMQEIK